MLFQSNIFIISWLISHPGFYNPPSQDRSNIRKYVMLLFKSFFKSLLLTFETFEDVREIVTTEKHTSIVR